MKWIDGPRCQVRQPITGVGRWGDKLVTATHRQVVCWSAGWKLDQAEAWTLVGVVAMAEHDGALFAMTQASLWRLDPGTSSEELQLPARGKGLVSDGAVLWLAVVDGVVRWTGGAPERVFEGRTTSGPVVVGDQIAFGTPDGVVLVDRSPPHAALTLAGPDWTTRVAATQPHLFAGGGGGRVLRFDRGDLHEAPVELRPAGTKLLDRAPGTAAPVRCEVLVPTGDGAVVMATLGPTRWFDGDGSHRRHPDNLSAIGPHCIQGGEAWVAVRGGVIPLVNGRMKDPGHAGSVRVVRCTGGEGWFSSDNMRYQWGLGTEVSERETHTQIDYLEVLRSGARVTNGAGVVRIGVVDAEGEGFRVVASGDAVVVNRTGSRMAVVDADGNERWEAEGAEHVDADGSQVLAAYKEHVVWIDTDGTREFPLPRVDAVDRPWRHKASVWVALVGTHALISTHDALFLVDREGTVVRTHHPHVHRAVVDGVKGRYCLLGDHDFLELDVQGEELRKGRLLGITSGAYLDSGALVLGGSVGALVHVPS